MGKKFIFINKVTCDLLNKYISNSLSLRIVHIHWIIPQEEPVQDSPKSKKLKDKSKCETKSKTDKEINTTIRELKEQGTLTDINFQVPEKLPLENTGVQTEQVSHNYMHASAVHEHILFDTFTFSMGVGDFHSFLEYFTVTLFMF